MTHAQILIESFNRIGLQHTVTETLIGQTITIEADRKQVDFEFDYTGTFLRIV